VPSLPDHTSRTTLLFQVVEELLREVERLARRQAATESEVTFLKTRMMAIDSEAADDSRLPATEPPARRDGILRKREKGGGEERTAAETIRERSESGFR